MKHKCENCGFTTEIKVEDYCPQCDSKKINTKKPEESLYVNSISNAENLQKIGITISVIMVVVGIIGIFISLGTSLLLLIPSFSLLICCMVPIDVFNSKAYMLKNIAEINKKLK